MKNISTTAYSLFIAILLLATSGSVLAQNLSAVKEIQTLDGAPISELEFGQSYRYRFVWQCSFVDAPPATGCGPFQLIDDLPDLVADGIPLEFTACNVTGDYTCTEAGSVVTIDKVGGSGGVNLLDGQSAEAFINVQLSGDPADWPGGVFPPVPPTIENDASITYDDDGDGNQETFGGLSADAEVAEPDSDNWQISKSLAAPGSLSAGPALDQDITYTIQLCPEGPAGTGTGTTPLTNVTITDLCDAGAELQSATLNGVPIAGVTQPDPLACNAPLVLNIGDLSPAQCHDVDVTLVYPSTVFDLTDPIRNEANAVSDDGSVDVCDLPCSNIVETELGGAVPTAGLSKSTARGELAPGALSQYTLGYDTSTSNVALSNVEIIDNFTTPDTAGTLAAFTIEEFSNLSWNINSVTANIYIVNDFATPTETLVVAGYNGDPNTLPAIPFPFAPTDEGFRIEFLQDVPPLFVMTGPTLSFRVDDATVLSPGDIIENCVDSTGTYIPPSPGMPIDVNETTCAQDVIIDPRADITPTKTMGSAFNPLGEFTADLTLSQSFTSTAGLTDPEIYDCLPPQLELVNPGTPVNVGDIVYNGFTYGGPPPTIDVLPAGDPNNNCPINMTAIPATQGEMLRIKWTGGNLTMPISNPPNPVGINTSIVVPVDLRVVEFTEVQNGLENLIYIGGADDGVGFDDYACIGLAAGTYDETNLDGTGTNLCQAAAEKNY